MKILASAVATAVMIGCSEMPRRATFDVIPDSILCKIIKQVTFDESPNQFCVHLKMLKAGKTLQEPALTITEATWATLKIGEPGTGVGLDTAPEGYTRLVEVWNEAFTIDIRCTMEKSGGIKLEMRTHSIRNGRPDKSDRREMIFQGPEERDLLAKNLSH